MDDQVLNHQKWTTRIIWGAITASLFLYYAVLYLVAENDAGARDVDGDLITTLTYVFPAMSVMALIGILVLRRLMFFRKFDEGDFESLEELWEAYFTASMITWGLVEAIALYGFVLSMLTHDLTYYPVFMIPALVLLVIYRPEIGTLVEEYGPEFPDDSTDDQEVTEPAADDDVVW